MWKKYWFKPKRYGWGFYPISWEGWLATLGLLGMVLISAYVNNFFTSAITAQDGFSFLFDLVVVIALSSVVFDGKTKGSVKWRWGK